MSRSRAAYLLTPSERQLHRTVAEFLDWALMPPAVYTTFPAGWGKLSEAMAGELRACGLKTGFPDILIFDLHPIIANRLYPKVVGIELKAKTGVSAAQQLMFPRLKAVGWAIYVCRDLESVVAALREQRVMLKTGWGTAIKEKDHAASDQGAEAGSAEEPTQRSLQ
jgi:hypothetical protein